MTRGWWNMHCFNALSDEQQAFLIERGYFPIGYKPDREDRCPRGAAVEVTTMWDSAPGPRFYCLPCAITYLTTMEKEL